MEKINNTDLVQYLYGESSIEHNVLIDNALKNDFNLHDEYKQLETTMQELQSLSYSPSQTTIDKILNYARSLEKCSWKNFNIN